MKRKFYKLVAVAAFVGLVGTIGYGQALQVERRTPNDHENAGQRTAQADRTVDSKSRQGLRDIIAHLLDTMYVSPEIGKQLAARMRAKFAGGAYNTITSPAQLAEALTQDLRELGKDKHLYVRFNSESADTPVLTVAGWENGRQQRGAASSARTRSPAGDQPRQMEMDAGESEKLRQANFHFRKIERLEGNVGYLDLGGFAPGGEAREAAAKAMAFLADTDAVIIDLRLCPGGAAEMVNFLATYFFGPEPRVLMTRYVRPTNETIQSTTVAEIPGRRMPDKDLYILTSQRSGSACESFPYTLQQYGRAMIVGEQTAGAGYNNALIPIGYGLTLSVSYGRPVHPRSGKGWEGVGVQPDIAVPADKALETAHKEALKSLIAKSTDESRRRELTRALQSLETKVAPVQAAPAMLEDYVGRYGNKEISIKDGGLYYQRIGGRGAALRAVGKDKFALNTDAQITFTRDAKSAVTEMLIEWVDRDKELLKREAPAVVNESNSQSQNQLPSQQPLSQAEQEVRKLEREWLNAYEKRDAEAMNRIVADDFTITQVNGAVQTKGDIMKELLRLSDAARPTAMFFTDHVSSRVFGETVILTGRVTQQMERDGQTRTMQARYTDVYVKLKGRWQVAASQLSPIMQPQQRLQRQP